MTSCALPLRRADIQALHANRCNLALCSAGSDIDESAFITSRVTKRPSLSTSDIVQFLQTASRLLSFSAVRGAVLRALLVNSEALIVGPDAKGQTGMIVEFSPEM